MKKIGTFLFVSLLSVIVFLLGFQEKNNVIPNYYYKVYLDDEVLGIIDSKEKLEEYIDKKGANIKEKYKVDKVYAPNGLQIKRIITYSDELNTIKEVYKKLEKAKPFTIEGYRFSIKREDEVEEIFTTSKEIFQESVINTMRTYVGAENYKLYDTDTQSPILTTGTILNDIYLEEEILVNEIKIPVNETIFTTASELSKYILFGTTESGDTYVVKPGDTIQKIADNNQIGVEAFLISNPELKSVDNILYNGQELSLAVPKPKVAIVAEYTSVEDRVSMYKVEEQNDPSMNIGDQLVVQNGVNGLDRVTSIIRKVNGEVTYAKDNKTVELEPAISKVIKIGTNKVSTVGSLLWWAWPTAGGWVSQAYGGRSHPIYGYYQFHQAVDIAGPGYYSPIYAANNGVVMELKYSPARAYGGNGYGHYVIINHNNGYYTLYAHMTGTIPSLRVGSAVTRGQIIGYMGATGDAKGPHLHFELWNRVPWSAGTGANGRPVGNLNPMSIY